MAKQTKLVFDSNVRGSDEAIPDAHADLNIHCAYISLCLISLGTGHFKNHSK